MTFKFAYAIEKVDNGFILKGPNPNAEGECTWVFSEDNTEHAETKALLEVYWELISLFGCRPSKHDNVQLTMGLTERKTEE